jgi:hypothetical protein
MTMAEFASSIRGFVHENVVLPDERREPVFVIGALEATDFLSRLRAFVLECERLRQIARGSRKAANPAQSMARNRGNSQGFSPEADIDGTGSGYPPDPRVIRRLHGRVVNALYAALGKMPTNEPWSDMRPDLYLSGPDGRIKTLFEVKASSDTQSWFTALGQLVVYGAAQIPAPQRVLVCPAVRKDPNFQKALAQLEVHLVTFEETKDGVLFTGLSSFMP